MLLVLDIYREIFAELGTSLEAAGVELKKCDPNYLVYFPTGDTFKMSTDSTVMKSEVERYEGQRGYEGYLRFLLEARKVYELSLIHILRKSFKSYLSVFSPSFLVATPSLHPFSNLYSRVSKYFKSDKLRQVFSFESLYVGVSPFRAVGSYSLLPYLELTEGLFYPKGGFESLITAIVKLGESRDVKYRFGANVRSVDVSTSGNATGVLLDNGEKVVADVVVMNADLIYAYNNLLPPSSTARSVKKSRMGCSMLSFFWSLDRRVPELATHNMFLSNSLDHSMKQMESNDATEHDVFYLHVPSRADASAAPPGRDAVIVHVPISVMPEENNDQEAGRRDVERYVELISISRKNILARLAKSTGHSTQWLQEAIISETVNTPLTWERDYNLHRGATFGISHDLFNLICFRPKPRHAKIKNLYFVGCNTHPGSGVPLCLAGAKMITEQILDASDMRIPWRKKSDTAERGNEGSGEPQILDLKRMASALDFPGTTLVFSLLFAALLFFAAMGRRW